ncbi:hypothetical protein CLOM_g11798 [Closterium sp. NIES-68]|nr:hypothetical protein CLOM_g11798 [Closterium sp. NIES-68]GJP83943.1 hypothetical protein CLOP_g14042 [Closterium sp. NIES-67]
MASFGKDKTEILTDAHVDQLEKELRDFKSDVSTWAEKQIAAHQEGVRRDSARVRTTQDKLNELRQLEQEFLAEEQMLLKQQSQQNDDLDRQCEGMARLGLEKASLEPQLQQAEEFVAELEADVQAEDDALKNEEEIRQQRIDALLSAVTKFREAFGLRFDPTPEGLLRMTFTKIDPLMPDRQFIALLDMGGDRDKGIQVVSSDPSIPGLAEAVQAAVSEGDLKGLFKGIYMEFRNAVAEGKL